MRRNEWIPLSLSLIHSNSHHIHGSKSAARRTPSKPESHARAAPFYPYLLLTLAVFGRLEKGAGDRARVRTGSHAGSGRGNVFG